MTLNLFNNGIHSLVRRWRRGLTFVVLASSATVAHGQSPKIPIRVVVVTTFEVGNDTGDRPGELQNWAGKFPLPDSLPLTDTYFGHLRYNPDLQVLAVVTGQGPQRTAATITALGQDPRFDLSHAYFVLAGIAGVDPNAGTVGSAFWASYVVDGSIGHEIDAREIPPDWPNGFTPVHHDHPNFQPVPDPNTMFGDNLFKLNPSLVAWAYAKTKDVKLQDNAALQAIRGRYTGFPEAQKPPSVMRGDVIATPIWWIGEKMNSWAEGWVKYWTHDQGSLATTANEDAGFMEAMSFLAKSKKVDMNRILILRTAANFDMQHPGQTAAELLAGESKQGSLSGYIPSLNAAYEVGNVVVRELAEHWGKFENDVP
ncbi:purine-nucleoside phosphorylase [Paraburkholderia agricolaris]|uniref:purine-nucleoside phosphorylase n=1 Tax=Paraburkholderia agricolaris TaxID=2152888 RepID=UPI001291FA3D|nr:purine nucleoside permease [Paraburkholderia agricolaris]